MTLTYTPYEQSFVDHIRAGGGDANGQPAERSISNGAGRPCRSCLQTVPKGAEMLILAARPFPAPQPYAEQGPIFLCARDCAPWEGAGKPEVMTISAQYLLKAYSADHRIIYGTGAIMPPCDIDSYAKEVFAREEVAFIDIRSASNNCFLTRVYPPAPT